MVPAPHSPTKPTFVDESIDAGLTFSTGLGTVAAIGAYEVFALSAGQISSKDKRSCTALDIVYTPAAICEQANRHPVFEDSLQD